MEDALAKCLEGDKQAWDDFVGGYATVIFSAVHRVLRGHGVAGETQTAEDVAQDVFLRLVKNDFHLLRSFDPSRASLATWLTIVARSAAIDFLRRKRLPSVPLDTAPPVEGPRPAGGAPPPGDPPVATGEMPLDILTARQRLVLKLLFDQEMDVAAVAALLGVSDQTVRSTKHKAMLRLREYFEKEDSL